MDYKFQFSAELCVWTDASCKLEATFFLSFQYLASVMQVTLSEKIPIRYIAKISLFMKWRI